MRSLDAEQSALPQTHRRHNSATQPLIVCRQTCEDFLEPDIRADAPNMNQHIVADTFLRFKGLERNAIIIVDLQRISADDDSRNRRLHIALTRALTHATVISTAEGLLRDPVLRCVVASEAAL